MCAGTCDSIDMSSSEQRKVLKKVSKQSGVELVHGGSGKVKVYRHGKYVTTLAQSPSSPSTFRNQRQALKNGGILI